MANKIRLYLNNTLKNNVFLKNILLVMTGTAMGQVINTMFSPIITRIYTPEEYGLLSVYSSILLIFSFSSLKYEMAIPIAKEKEDAQMLVYLSILILISVTTLTTVLLIFFSDNLLRMLNAEILLPYKYLIPIGILFQGIYLIYRQWMFRIKNFKLVSTSRIYQNLVGNSIKVLLGLLNFGGFGLIIGRVLVSGAGSNNLYKEYKRTKAKNSFNLSNIKINAIKYKDFPLFQATSAILVNLRNQLPIFLLTPVYGSKVVGLYGLANTVVKIPMTLIGQSVMDVFFAETASIGKSNPKKIRNLSKQLLKQLVIIGLVPTLAMFILGPILFSFVFGHEWIEAGVYVRILSIYIYSNLVFSPISKIFEVFEKQKTKFTLDILSIILVFFVFILSYLFGWNARISLINYSLTMTFIYLLTYTVAQRILIKESKKMK